MTADQLDFDERFGVGRAMRLTSRETRNQPPPKRDGHLALLRESKKGLRWIARTRSFGVQFEPRYIFRAGRLDQ